MKRILSRAAVTLAAITAIGQQHATLATNYYFNGDGGTGGAGTQANPYRTLAPINTLDFDPGDNVFLSGNFNTPTGGIELTAQDAGAANNPVSFIGVGSSRPTINAFDSFGFKDSDAGGIDLKNINFIGNGPASRNPTGPDTGLFTNTQDGVRFYTNDGTKKDHIHVDNVYVRGFGINGIKVGADTGQSGFNDVQITNSIAEKNQHAGVNFEGDFNQANRSAHTNVLISNVRALDNSGRANRPDEGNTGSGIVIGQVNGGVIQYSVAKNNGKDCASTAGGPVGIWAWDSNNVKIQYNESFNNGTAGHHDGGGFDLDGGVTNSVMQYNYSHGNDGAGFLLAEFAGAKPFTGNVIRYNVSQADGRKNGYGGIHAFGSIGSTLVYNNTIFMPAADKNQPNTRDEAPAAVRFRDGTLKDIDFYNNLFVIKSNDGNDAGQFNPDMLNLAGASEQTFNNNDYWRIGLGAFTNPADPHSWNLDPLLLDAGNGGTFDDIENYRLPELLEYQLDDSSPLIDRGLNLWAYGIDPGVQDFYGNGPHGQNYDIGAHESLVGGPFVPEPATGLVMVGIAAIGVSRRRRRCW